MYFFFSSRRRHTRWPRDWSSDVCSSDLAHMGLGLGDGGVRREAVVERHPCPVGDHVAGDAARDGDGVEALAVLEPVDHGTAGPVRSEEHTSELQSRGHLVCRLLLDKKKKSNIAQDNCLYINKSNTLDSKF